MKNILLIGAGKSATVCLEFLAEKSMNGEFGFTVADASLEILQEKTKHFPHVQLMELDATDHNQRAAIIKGKNVVISLLPPHLHSLVAIECVEQSVHLLNASYQDEKIKVLENDIKEKGLLFISELGLDPGIDHMSAMKMITEIKKKGGHIESFLSHCGGLIAPEDDDNPWHYKISWNPRNIVMAGKSGAKFLANGKEVELDYKELFDAKNTVHINGTINDTYGFYPNRDSLSYVELYQLQEASSFIRTTLRHKDFLTGWSQVVAFELTNEDVIYDSDVKTMNEILLMHLTNHAFVENWESLKDNINFTRQIDFLFSPTLDVKLNKGMVSIADVLQFCMEEKLKLGPTDKDLIIMQHDVHYMMNEEKKFISSTLAIKGKDSIHTAMAKTVGLPLAITALLILEDKIDLTGLHIPIDPKIYEPVLNKLEKAGIVFEEKLL